MSLVELDKLIRERQELICWLSLAKNRDSQSGSPWVLRVDVNGVQAMYCGQYYAGAKNYHDAPSGFNSELKDAIDRNRKLLVDDAAKTYLAKLEMRINALRQAAEAVFAATACKGIEIEPGVYSGCNAAQTGANDCPRCGVVDVTK